MLNTMMKKLFFLLFFCLLIISGCTNISETKRENSPKETSASDVNSSGNYTPEYNFTDEEIDSAMKVAKTYYNDIGISDDIKSIEYNLSSDVYGGAFGSLSQYKNSNSIIFLARTKDDNIPRIIILTRKDKNSDWNVVNEGH